MPVTEDQVAALRAQLSGDFDEYRRLLGQLDREAAATGYTALIAAAFFKAAYRRFGKNPSPEQVVAFVGDLRSRSDELADIDPVAAERIIRSALGDGEVSDIDSKTRVAVESVVLARLVADERFDSAELDKFMSEARKLADYWTRG